MAGYEQGHAASQKFSFIEALPPCFSGHKVPDQVIAWVLALVCDQTGQIRADFDQAALGSFQDLQGRPVDTLEGKDIVRPAFEEQAILSRGAEDLSDDDGGQRTS
jgi:hypothetical protein